MKIKAKFIFQIRFLIIEGRHNYVTPTSYLQLLYLTKKLMQKKGEELLTSKKRYVVGLEKLAFAASQVRTHLSLS